MVLVDTSVWIRHFRKTEVRLVDLLEREEVACHPMILGELACGQFSQRRQALRDLSALPLVHCCEDREVMELIERRRLYGTGVSWVDVHLLASALTQHLRLWTHDNGLAKQATRLGVVGSMWP
jgi:predicted nucleic acid-binding protein